MKNPFNVIKNFFSEEPEEGQTEAPKQGSGIYCQNCNDQIMNKPKFFKLEGRQIVICKKCLRHFKKGMGA